uniref:Uncharacterized protein n=1 Tax=Glossina pallidipes TaxID=7398 RepID=A0A1B0AIU5_GLOPL
MTERKFTRALNKPGMAAQLRESVSQVVRESAVLFVGEKQKFKEKCADKNTNTAGFTPLRALNYMLPELANFSTEYSNIYAQAQAVGVISRNLSFPYLYKITTCIAIGTNVLNLYDSVERSVQNFNKHILENYKVARHGGRRPASGQIEMPQVEFLRYTSRPRILANKSRKLPCRAGANI